MNFFNVDSGFYRFLDRFTDFFLLNLLWLIMCIPIVTIFPATAAMFGVVRKWRQQSDAGVFRIFYQLFRENFKQSFGIGLIWAVLGFIFYFNISVSLQMTGTLKMIMIPILSIMGLVFLMTSIYIFPVMVHYKLKWFHVIKNSFLYAVSQLWITVVCSIILIGGVSISIFWPVTAFIVWSIAVYGIFFLCNKTFEKVEAFTENSAA